MSLFKDIGGIGLAISFVSGVSYELTGFNSLKFISLASLIFSVGALSSYLSEIKHLSRAKDLSIIFKFLK